jgi:SAM-dependent methyltransferase
VVAYAPNTASAVAGALLVSGIAFPTIRIASTILVNRRATSEARATIHSLLSQAENVGEIVFGLALAFIATSVSATAAFVACAVLLAGAGIVVRATHDEAPRPDEIFAEPRLAQIYDAIDNDRSDLDVYAALVDELGAGTIVDVGCGTGVFACLLARRGKNVTAIDPARASLAVARSKPNADAVQWLEGDASNAPACQADLVTMTGNVAQVFLTDRDWLSSLQAAWTALRGGGYLVFEVRDPARRAWETWTPATSQRRLDVPGGGTVNNWLELTKVSLPFVSFRHTFVFEADGSRLTSDSTLRFRERGEIVVSLEDVGFIVREIRDAPDRPGLEWVFIAQRPAG